MSLSPLQLDAAAGLLQNQGISVNAELTIAITAYNSTALISPLLSTITTAASGNILSAPNLADIQTLGNIECPALGDSVPSGFSFTTSNVTPGFSGVISTTASTEVGNGDVSKFTQALAIAQGYASQTNLFIDSAVNSQTYMGTTFTNMNNMTTGDITSVNLATGPFAKDIANLGNLIDLNNLGNLGSPLALVQRISAVAGNVPVLSVYFIAEGIPQEVVVNFNNPTANVTDSIQKLMYNAMLKITDTALAQVLAVLKITTVGINTMADLLNPVKLFPNSYQSLTAPTATGPRAIYINNVGTVNSALATELPLYVVSSLA